MRLPASLTEDTQFRFDARRHTYYYGRRRLKSVSRWINDHKQPFEEDYWANRKAEELGMTPDEVKAMWRAKGDASRKLGHEVHDLIEHHLLESEDIDARIEKASEEARARFALYLQLREGRLKDAEVLATELRVYSLTLGLAGTLDTLMRLPSGKVLVGDWKTNGRFRTGEQGFGRLLGPFRDLRENEGNIYAIQVALYRLMLAEHGVKVDGAFICHLGPNADEPVVFFPPDMRPRVMLALEGN